MPTTPQHTPTPWSVLTYDGDSRVWVCVEGNDLDGIAIDGPDKFRSVELAERIVRAVNAFEPMREALESARWLLEERISQAAWLELTESQRAEYSRVLTEIRAALTLAEEES